MHSGKCWINKLSLCAMVYRETAEMLGYDSEEAKSFGLAIALSFLIEKDNRRVCFPPKSTIYDILELGGERLCCVLEDNEYVRAFFGGKIVQPDSFDRVVRKKVIAATSTKVYINLRQHIKDALINLRFKELESKMVSNVYERFSDEVRKSGFVEKLMKMEAHDVGVST